MVRLFLVGLAAATLLGCTARDPSPTRLSYTTILAGEVDSQFQRVTGPIHLRFPLDHGVHPDYQVEWWYLTGYLVDELGQEYGYQFTLFRFGLQRHDLSRTSLFGRSHLFMGHFAIADVSRQLYLSAEHFARAPANADVTNHGEFLTLHLDDWNLTIQEDNAMELRAHAHSHQTDFGVNFRLRAEGPLLLHGEDGFSRKGPEQGQASMYYSVIDLDTSGHLQIGEHELQVRGTSWFDHEWSTGSLAPDAVGWDWFSLQWDNGAALMLGVIRGADPGTVTADTAWPLQNSFPITPLYVDPDGSIHQLAESAYAITVTDHWTSNTTGVRYPSGWHLEIPAIHLECQMEPLLKNQEFIGVGIYWEGLVGAVCMHNGTSTRGRGYVELTGYS